MLYSNKNGVEEDKNNDKPVKHLALHHVPYVEAETRSFKVTQGQTSNDTMIMTIYN